MDDLSAKLKKLWKPKPKTFRGKGNVLGRAETAPAQPRIPDRALPKESPPSRQPYQGTAHTLSGEAAPKPDASTRRTEPAPSSPVQPRHPGPHGETAARKPTSCGSSIPLDAEEQHQLEEATALLLSSQQGRQGAITIVKVLANILAHPAEAKYRKLRLANKRIQETIVNVDGGVELLQACGFELVFQEANADKPEGLEALEGFAVMPEHTDLALPEAALQLLGHQGPVQQPHNSSSGASSSQTASSSCPTGQAGRTPSDSATSAAQQRPAMVSAPEVKQQASRAAICPRNTQVFFPAETPDQSLPRWFFDRSPSEVKAAFLAKHNKDELDKTLMTRAYREKLNAPKQSVNSIPCATIRIRLPEGLVLQGEFNAGEPVSAVFEWVTDCLSDPCCTYQLVGPDRKPVNAAGKSMRSAQLVPSALLNFTGGTSQDQPSLRPEILRLAQ